MHKTSATVVDFRLYAIGDRSKVPDLPEFVKQASDAGLRAFQLREKDLLGRSLFELAKDIRSVTTECRLFINDRIDIGMAIGAQGIHLPEKSWPLALARRVFPTFTFGASVHSLEGAIDAAKAGADFIVFGPVFETPSKQSIGINAKGMDALKVVCNGVTIPTFAIGGMTPERAAICRNAGAHGVAVMSDLLMASNLMERITAYREALGSL